MPWLRGAPVWLGQEQVAEVRNKRTNGTVGVCFGSESLPEVRAWLTQNYPGWSRAKEPPTGPGQV